MEGMIVRRMPVVIAEHEEAKSKGEVIHSGHFMISSVADQDDVDDEDSHDRDSPVHHDQAIRIREGYDFSEVRKETQNTYQFGHRSTNQITIDASLSRLFECMSLAYRGGKVVSPKWKNFKGMRLSVKDKIRLNNAIWRTWHIQYIMRRRRSKLSFVQFATPLDNESDCDSHSKPEAVVMEGKYWKRRIETVVAEYKKWRAFFMDKLQQTDHPGLMWVSHQSPATPEMHSMDILSKADDAMFMDLTDRLFSRLSQPFQFPNPREIAQHATNSDMMQPGLLQLQPTIEDFMDPLDTLQDIFSPSRKSPAVNGMNNVSLFYSQPSQQHHDYGNAMITQHDLNSHAVQEASLEELVQRATAGHDPNIMCITDQNIDPSQQMQMRTQEQQMQMQHSDMNFGVSDPMMTQVNDKLYPQYSNNIISTTSPMMISKQQQDTPTISQVVMSRSQHPHLSNTSIQSQYQTQTRVQTTMPPPQKKAPRRRSMNNKFNNNVGVTTSPPMTVQQQQPMNSTDVQMQMNYQHSLPQMGNNQVQVQTQLNSPFTTTLQQVIINPQTGNYTVTQHPQQQQQANQMQAEKLERPPQLNTPILTAAVQDIIIDSINASNRNVNSNRKENSNQVPALILPVSIQRALANQVASNAGGYDQPPQKKQLLIDNASDNIDVKQSTNSQHIPIRQQTLLTQLLASGRPAQAASKPPTTQPIQIPLNMVIAPTREAQLKRVQEQSANFNTFQNSVLMAAAQMAVTPQSQQQQHVAPPDTNAVNMNTVACHHSSPAPTITQEIVKKPFVSSLGNTTAKAATPDRDESTNIWTPQMTSSKWQPQTLSQITTMDIDESVVQSKEDFVNAMEKSVTSPASSTASSTSSDHRSHHFTAEQKRRCNIKSLCDRLQEILPEISNHPTQKVSKAVLLNKSCNHIRQLQAARQQTTTEIQQLKTRIESLNEDISNFQGQLPATGAPVSRHRGDRMQLVFDEWVRDRTLRDWKFFIFSMIIQPWFMTYDQTVSVANLEELCRSCLMWLEKNCALPELRRGVVNSLQELGTTTSILTDPANLQQQAEHAVQQGSRHSSNSSS